MKVPRPPFLTTEIERILFKFLEDAGFQVIKEKRFGRFRVDTYLPERHIAFEADGAYWHKLNEADNPGCYVRRDQILLEKYGLPVVRLTEREVYGLAAIAGGN